MDASKINLMYIASIGRSGTTLLDCILGAHSQMASIGEIHLWPHEILQGGVLPCGSGAFVQDDPFWQEMEDRIRPLEQPAPQIHFFREAHDGGRTLRPNRLGDFFSSVPGRSSVSRIKQYAANNDAIYRNFSDSVFDREGTRPKWIVDSSKDPYRLNWLVQSGRFNIKVIHLVRNPKGFIHSVTKPHIYGDDRYEPSSTRRLYWTLRQAGAWTVRNCLISATADRYMESADYLLLTYEALASEPEASLHRICEVAGVPFEPQAIENFRSGSPYAIAGNPMRQREGGIRLDQQWKRRLPRSSRYLTDAITAPIRSKYRY